MINKAQLKELRDERGFRKAMDNGDSWTMLTMELYRTEDEKCYWEVEKHEFFTKDGKKDAKWDLLDRGTCAWSSFAFEHHLKPIWEELIAEHKADDYFVDDWTEHPEFEVDEDEYWAQLDDGAKYNMKVQELKDHPERNGMSD